MFKEKQLIKCNKEEIVRFQNFEFNINEQVDNLLILVSTGALIFSSNLIQHLSYSLSSAQPLQVFLGLFPQG